MEYLIDKYEMNPNYIYRYEEREEVINSFLPITSVPEMITEEIFVNPRG